ncbi:MAG: hypothetical protein ACI4PE_05340 [Bacilli bacterium]
MNNNKKETQLLYIQMYGSILFIITIIVSTILTYNNIKKNTNEKKIFSEYTENEINLTNRIVITILVIIFTYINYCFYQINKQKNKSNLSKQELIASILTLISGFILLNTTIKSIKNNINNINTNTPIF